MKQTTNSKTIFYDNACGLCNGFVSWIQTRDKLNIFKFSPLQDPQLACPIELDADPRNWSVILVDSEGVWESSDAVLRILDSLGGVYRMSWLLRVAPKRLRNLVYRFIARHRS